MKVSLDEMATFVEVVDCGNFSKASQKSDTPVSTVSRRIAGLERRLDVQLLHRTTRQQRLTDIGVVYYEHCSRMLAEAEAAELAVQNLQAEPSGVLRISIPFPLDDPFSSHMVLSFLRKHPKVSIELIVNTRKVDLVEEKFDCAMIPGTLEDSSLIARGIGSARIIVCASPGYIKEYGMPLDIENLQSHHLVNYQPPAWLGIQEDPIVKLLSSRLLTNDFVAARRAAIDGLGITRLSEVQIKSSLDKGELVEVLPDLAISVPVNLVFPSNRQFTTKLRAYIDHMVEFSSKYAPWEFD